MKEGKWAANQRFFNGKMKVREPASVTGTAAEGSRNRSVTVRKLAQAYGVSTETIHATLHKDLNLSKMSVTVGPKAAQQGDEEGASEDMQGILGNGHCHSMATLKKLSLWTSLWCPFTPLKPSNRASSGWERVSLAPSRPKSRPAGARRRS